MEGRPLEITLISAKDIKDVNILCKMDVYAEVSIKGDHYNPKQTPIDKRCGTSPKWNYTMKFNIPGAAAEDNRLTVEFKLISRRCFGNKEIGEVRVPIKELLDHHKAGDGRVISYGVRTPSGKSKGTLNFSSKFGEKFEPPWPAEMAKNAHLPVMSHPSPADYPGVDGTSAYPPPGAYSPPAFHMEVGGGHRRVEEPWLCEGYRSAYPYPPGWRNDNPLLPANMMGIVPQTRPRINRPTVCINRPTL